MTNGYVFSKQGLSHKKRDVPCQDYSVLKQLNKEWFVLGVADGVGSCKHSDEASEAAAQGFIQFAEVAFPYCKDPDIEAFLYCGMNCAANFVERLAAESGDINDYQTTLCVAVYNSATKELYYGNAGDSGIIALDDYGEFHVLSVKQDNEYGEVCPLSHRKFEIGKADFSAAAAVCLTDGLLDWVVPKSLADYKYNIHVPRAELLIDPEMFNGRKYKEEDFDDMGRTAEDRIAGLVRALSEGETYSEKLGSLGEGNLSDDLSAAVLINTETGLRAEEIAWEPLPEEYIHYTELMKLRALYKGRAEKMFIEALLKSNEDMTEEKAEMYLEHLLKYRKKKNAENAEAESDVKELPPELKEVCSETDKLGKKAKINFWKFLKSVFIVSGDNY